MKPDNETYWIQFKKQVHPILLSYESDAEFHRLVNKAIIEFFNQGANPTLSYKDTLDLWSGYYRPQIQHWMIAGEHNLTLLKKEIENSLPVLLGEKLINHYLSPSIASPRCPLGVMSCLYLRLFFAKKGLCFDTPRIRTLEESIDQHFSKKSIPHPLTIGLYQFFFLNHPAFKKVKPIIKSLQPYHLTSTF